MKATVISVFKSKEYKIPYGYVSAKRFHDDFESVSGGEFVTPMMEIRLWKEKLHSINDRWVRVDSVITFATPEVINKYTGLDLFEVNSYWCFRERYLDIEFEWVEQEYPYLKRYSYRDSVWTDPIRMAKITSIGELHYGVRL